MDNWIRVVLLALSVTVTLPKSLRLLEERRQLPYSSWESERLLEDKEPSGESDTNHNGTWLEDDTGSSSKCSCDWRYLRHYEAKGCTPVNQTSCGCPVKFECPSVNEIEENQNTCYYKGLRYPAGAVINTSNSCERCRCSRGPDVHVMCFPVDCPQFQSPLEPNCHYVYEKNRCCPVRTVCVGGNKTSEIMEAESLGITCEHNGRVYPLGAKIFTEDDPCEVCLCEVEEWAQTGDLICYQTDCGLEKSRSKLLEGCVPIYQDNICCPVDFYCAPDDDFIAGEVSEDVVKEEESESAQDDADCLFGGKLYNIGQTVSVNQENSCLSCTCRVPPDFTCIRQLCEPSRSENLCYPYFTADSCCPKYECMLSEEPLISNMTISRLQARSNRELEDEGTISRPSDPEHPCYETHCSEDSTCMLYQVMCGNTTCPPVPTCLKTNSSCLTPVCASGCVVTEQDQYNCPVCICGEDVDKHVSNLKCHMPHCVGQNCHLVAGGDGCPICSCDKPCGVLECPRGCNVETKLEGRCPQCVCEDETVGCPTPICAHEGCRIENLPNGCPTCICDRGNVAARGRAAEPSGPSSHHHHQQQQEQVLDIPTEQQDTLSEAASDDYDEVVIRPGRSSSAGEIKANLKERSLSESSDDRTLNSQNWHIFESESTEANVNSIEGGEGHALLKEIYSPKREKLFDNDTGMDP